MPMYVPTNSQKYSLIIFIPPSEPTQTACFSPSAARVRSSHLHDYLRVSTLRLLHRDALSLRLHHPLPHRTHPRLSSRRLHDGHLSQTPLQARQRRAEPRKLYCEPLLMASFAATALIMGLLLFIRNAASRDILHTDAALHHPAAILTRRQFRRPSSK
jgi:hypothetical protein